MPLELTNNKNKMFKIDLGKWRPSKKIDSAYLCNVRKRLITATP
jgi:hypothetical protein